MARKKKAHAEEPEKENSERWLLTYSDLITLLMAFFIVLYAMSKPSESKYQEVAQALSEAFGSVDLGIFENAGSGGRGLLEGGGAGAGKVSVPARSRREELMKKSQMLLKDMIKGNQLSVSSHADGIKITLYSDIFFKSMSPELSYDAAPALTRIADMLGQIDNDVRIEGNTDDTANYSQDQQDLNWDLSSERALNVLKYLQMLGVDGRRMIAVANGSTKPVKPNATPEGRSYNRRVDIIILY